MRLLTLLITAMAATTASAAGRFVMYFDQWHKDNLPTDKSLTAGITHVVTGFAPSTAFQWSSSYAPFMPLARIRAMFDPDVKVCMAIGGWGDTDGFSAACKTDASRKTYARNVAAALTNLGYDCVDIDWEYPGGNGENYRTEPNSGKVNEIDDYPLLLKEIKAAIGNKELSIAVPGKEVDMIAFTAEKVPEIDNTVDYVNVMAYDLMNRRDTTCTHHTSLQASLHAIQTYTQRGMTPAKMNLGIAYYAKWFATAPGTTCTQPVGCPAAQLEAPDGTDTGRSSAVTFEPANRAQLFGVLSQGKVDEERGGAWWWDPAAGKYWTWDTPEIVADKFDGIVRKEGLGGVMAWSLGEDTYDWGLLKAMQKGVAVM